MVPSPDFGDIPSEDSYAEMLLSHIEFFHIRRSRKQSLDAEGVLRPLNLQLAADHVYSTPGLSGRQPRRHLLLGPKGPQPLCCEEYLDVARYDWLRGRCCD